MSSWEWWCSWSSADRWCSNYIWVINNFFAYQGASYIRGFTVVTETLKEIMCKLAIISLPVNGLSSAGTVLDSQIRVLYLNMGLELEWLKYGNENTTDKHEPVWKCGSYYDIHHRLYDCLDWGMWHSLTLSEISQSPFSSEEQGILAIGTPSHYFRKHKCMKFSWRKMSHI